MVRRPDDDANGDGFEPDNINFGDSDVPEEEDDFLENDEFDDDFDEDELGDDVLGPDDDLGDDDLGDDEDDDNGDILGAAPIEE